MNGINNLVDHLHDTGLLYQGILNLLAPAFIKDLEACRKTKRYWEKLNADFPKSKLKDNDKLEEVIASVGAFLDDKIADYEKGQ